MLHGWLILLRRGAATDVLKARGLYAVSSFPEITRDDFENTRLQSPVSDALYAYCRTGRA
jgi:hypothetical protein